MTRYFAFLRALNVGGHTVKMTELATEFESLGYRAVETFISSGNVIFEATGRGSTSSSALERRIEARLLETLGYEVRTFLRTDAELLAAHHTVPFPDVVGRDGDTMQVGFLPDAPPGSVGEAVAALSDDHEHLVVIGRELYWLIHGTSLDTSVKPGALKRAFDGMPLTARNIKTVRRLVTKYDLG